MEFTATVTLFFGNNNSTCDTDEIPSGDVLHLDLINGGMH